ncbi:MAG: NAD(P)/FAD-dependent oxidoreductase [Hyphomicrobium sp.]|nr:NAD(P)/FAD-dependent oxidoreductase [Hyphomicrobium sp.]
MRTEGDLTTYDVAIIGAGVIGCAIARRFALEGAHVVVLEKAADILDGASKGNSAILHTGFDAPPGSLEQACVADGYREYVAIHERLGLPLIQTGALVLAWTDDEEAQLPLLVEQARRNGVDDVQLLSRTEILVREPHLSPLVRAGFVVPREHIIDPWTAPYAYLLQAVVNGAVLKRGCAVRAGQFDGAAWTLDTSAGSVSARAVINAAGLYGDQLDAALVGRQQFTIRPRKGQFIVYDKPASALVRHILLPVPTKTTKGIVVCRTAFGNVLVGPTAEEQTERDCATLSSDALARLRTHGAAIVPALGGVDVTASYAGLRPATEFKDYQVHAEPARRYITVGGIRSTGLTSALGTAAHVFRLYAAFGDRHSPLAAPVWPVVRNISEYSQRSWQCPANGGIVCHCERVTRADIMSALDGPIPVLTPAGLKRRTRATLGRCQGFYCTAELAELTKDRLTEPYAEPIHDV